MPDQFCLFTTLRFTCPDRCGVFGPDNAQNRTFITKGDVPLIDRHIARLRTAHAHYVNHEGESKWGTWPGDEQVWEAIHAVLQNIADEGPGDYRVRESCMSRTSPSRSYDRSGGCQELTCRSECSYTQVPDLKSKRPLRHGMPVH
jgi:hypothetical protein